MKWSLLCSILFVMVISFIIIIFTLTEQFISFHFIHSCVWSLNDYNWIPEWKIKMDGIIEMVMNKMMKIDFLFLYILSTICLCHTFSHFQFLFFCFIHNSLSDDAWFYRKMYRYTCSMMVDDVVLLYVYSQSIS